MIVLTFMPLLTKAHPPNEHPRTSQRPPALLPLGGQPILRSVSKHAVLSIIALVAAALTARAQIPHPDDAPKPPGRFICRPGMR